MYYLEDKNEKNEDLMSDIFKPEQYIYGRTKRAAENHIYLVDIELMVSHRQSDMKNEQKYNIQIDRCIKDIARFIALTEKKTGLILYAARNQINKLIDLLDEKKINFRNFNKNELQRIITEHLGVAPEYTEPEREARTVNA